MRIENLSLHFPKLMRGKLIVFEGVDKTGKSTCIKKLKAFLDDDDIQYMIFEFPSKNSLTENIISSCKSGITELHPKALHLIFSANRWEKISVIQSYLDNGINVFCDRYFFSGIAYSVGKYGLDFEWCCKTEEGLIMPDHVFYLHGDKDLLLSRGFGQDAFEDKNDITKIHATYCLLFNENWTVINVNNPLEKIIKIILKQLKKCLL